MQLKQPDLKTFETYKKAMRMSASQIKDDTKFCIYNEVQLPDAGGKMHILKPFLVVGNGKSTFQASAAAPEGRQEVHLRGHLFTGGR
jgi:hypothetical protein